MTTTTSTKYRIEEKTERHGWQPESTGTTYTTREEAEADVPSLAESYGCDESELRVVESR